MDELKAGVLQVDLTEQSVGRVVVEGEAGVPLVGFDGRHERRSEWPHIPMLDLLEGRPRLGSG